MLGRPHLSWQLKEQNTVCFLAAFSTLLASLSVCPTLYSKPKGGHISLSSLSGGSMTSEIPFRQARSTAEQVWVSPANFQISWERDQEHLSDFVEFGAFEVFKSFNFSPWPNFFPFFLGHLYAMFSLLFKTEKRNCLFDDVSLF